MVTSVVRPGNAVRTAKCRKPLVVGIPDPQGAGRRSPQKGNDRPQLRTEGVPDLSWCRNARRYYLGTGEYDGDHRFGLDLHLVVAGHGGEGNVGRVQDGAGRDEHVTGCGFFACRTYVLARLRLAVFCVGSEREEGCRQRPSGTWPLSLRRMASAPSGTSPPVAMTLASGRRKASAVCKDPGTTAVYGPAVHGGRGVMGEVFAGR